MPDSRVQVMKKTIHTFFDRVNNCDDNTILLKHIAKMMAMQNKEYTEAFMADELRYELAGAMLEYDHTHNGVHYEVVCTYRDITEASSFRAHKISGGLIDMSCDIMDIEQYMDKVINPVAKELAARVISRVDGPLFEMDCDIQVRAL